MISVPGIYVLIFVVFIFALSAAYQIAQYRKRLRQYREDAQARTQAIQNHINRADKHGIEQQLRRHHQDNAWARDAIKEYDLDQTTNPSARKKWIFSIYIIAIALGFVFIFYHRTYIEYYVIKLAQNPKNLMHGCMYYDKTIQGRYLKIYFLIEEKRHELFYIQVKNTPAEQKFRTHRFEKNRCYKIKYIKITIPIFNTERIYVYDINL